MMMREREEVNALSRNMITGGIQLLDGLWGIECGCLEKLEQWHSVKRTFTGR